MKSIFLVNPISARGHLDAYARLYSRAFIELGYRVVLLAESDGGTPDYLRRNVAGREDFFTFISFAKAESLNAQAETLCTQAQASNDAEVLGCKSVQRKPRAKMNVIQRARLVWREDGIIGILKRFLIVPSRLARALVPEAVRVHLSRQRQKLWLKLTPMPIVRTLAKFVYPDAGRIPFRAMVRHVCNARAMSEGMPVDLVVYLYLDLMAEGHRNVKALDGPDCKPWTGILFHPRLVKLPNPGIERYFRSRNARGSIFLVPTAVDIYANIAPRQTFALVPDVADLEVATELPRIAQEIRGRAQGRKIILQVGTIAPHKGIMTLLDVIALADTKRFFFALVGEVHWRTFGEDEKRLRAFYEQPPQNVYVHEGYLQEERDYNALIATGDAIYAVYSGFNSSSNSLTKAAGLQRPIVVAKNTLMGDRVLASGIGLAASEGDASDILRTLNSLVTSSSGSFDFQHYANDHSVEKLKSVLAKALPRWLGERSIED